MEEENYSLKIEATEVIKEISFAVHDVKMSKALPNTDENVYFNLETKEHLCYCVELTPKGFRLASHKFDTLENGEDKYYETIYSLLDSISPEYRNTFGDTLIQKLQGLQNSKDDGVTDDPS
ncbi:GSK3B-interacting protein-like [Dreissena polymorpha]|uniref:GSKIP domain-containing protein n=1 Tax=Dreissena polymorpha TaxID=45954 RepID=A0A9D4HZF2_DREPO|nr:GSK3B-interacting protein-like [Dreissena polymorpha]KAH3738473.1 hypothetical protein DPMN_045107 [Dreissena polymorpha]